MSFERDGALNVTALKTDNNASHSNIQYILIMKYNKDPRSKLLSGH